MLTADENNVGVNNGKEVKHKNKLSNEFVTSFFIIIVILQFPNPEALLVNEMKKDSVLSLKQEHRLLKISENRISFIIFMFSRNVMNQLPIR